MSCSSPKRTKLEPLADIADYLFCSEELVEQYKALSDEARDRLDAIKDLPDSVGDWSVDEFREFMTTILEAEDPVVEFNLACTTDSMLYTYLLWYLSYQLVKYDARSFTYNEDITDVLDTFLLAIVLIKDSRAARNFGAMLEHKNIKSVFFGWTGLPRDHKPSKTVASALYNYCTCRREDDVDFLNSSVRDYTDMFPST